MKPNNVKDALTGDYCSTPAVARNYKENGNPPSRPLFDMAAVAILKNSSWADSVTIPKPELLDGNWIDKPENTSYMIIWENFNSDAIINDFFSLFDGNN